jgi:hypothetical protein
MIHDDLAFIIRLTAAGPPILPPTVVDQIQLWENERDRFIFTEGVLYSQFLSQADFDILRDYAQDLGVLTWQNERRRTMVRCNLFSILCKKYLVFFHPTKTDFCEKINLFPLYLHCKIV